MIIGVRHMKIHERQTDRSPLEQLADLEARYGSDVAQKLDCNEAFNLYYEGKDWASDNDAAMVDYWKEQFGNHFDWVGKESEAFIEVLLKTLGTMAEHLKRGQALGLSATEQAVVDSLYSWLPHDYEDNYVACAREVNGLMTSLLPPESEGRTQYGFLVYYVKVMEEAKKLAAKHEVDFDTSDYSLSICYLYELMTRVYGIEIDNPLE